MGAEVYRSMEASGGRPAVDASRTTLGVKLRDSPDILMDEHRFVYPKTGGLSVAPIPTSLPTSKRPPSLGGTSRNPVWKLDIDNLPASLVLTPTSTKHGLIEPTEPTRAEEFQRTIHGLEALWVQVQTGQSSANFSRELSPQKMSRYQAAIHNDQPVTSLRKEVGLRLLEGIDANAVWAELAELRSDFERTQRRYEEEAVAEVMDMLEGWCPPRLYLRPADE